MREYQTIKINTKEPIATILFNGQGKLNILNTQMLKDFYNAIKYINNNYLSCNNRALIILGDQKGFIAGLDLNDLNPKNSDYLESLNMCRKAIRTLEYLPIPTIAAVNKYALGGGLEIALACDFIFSDNGAKFGFPEVNFGLIPGAGGTVLLPKKIGISKAKDLIYSGKIIDCNEAKNIGLVDKIFLNGELLESAKDYLKQIIKHPRGGIAAAKKSIIKSNSDYEQRCFDKRLKNPSVKQKIKEYISFLRGKNNIMRE
ncbi:MAG: enoyl-CoA hydratase/isomerase family protein [Candidatus Woesearchaeota archaeon]